MIRPLTFVSMLLAAGSGLYLYQSKQQARVLDRQIADIRGAAAALHQRAEVLRAEYTLLNDPTRLSGLATTYLPDLKPTQPGQWTLMAELDKRLPQVGDAIAAPSPLEPAGPAAAPDAPAPQAPPIAAAEPPPQPQQAGTKPVAARPPLVAHAAAPRPIVALAHDPAPARRAVPLDRPPATIRTTAFAGAPTVPTTQVLATLRPAPAAPPPAAPAAPAAAPMVASALGMARTVFAPVTPANAAAVAASSREGAAR